MDYTKLFEAYLGYEPNFIDDIILQDDGNGIYIAEWNIPDKPKPDLKQLETDYADEYNRLIQIEELKRKIKKARELILRANTYAIDEVRINDRINTYRQMIKKYKETLNELQGG